MSDAETEVKPSETDAPVETGESTTPEVTESKDEPSRAQKRINQLTWEKNEAARKAAELERKLAEKEQPKPDPVSALSDIPVPKYEDFDSDADFQSALQKYNAQAFTRLHEQTQESEAQRQAVAKQQAERADYQKKVAAFAAQNDDFVEIVSQSTVHISDDVTDILVGSEKAPELTLWLAQNPEAADRLNNLPPVQAARELGRIEFQIETAAPKTVSDAPAPMTDLGGGDSPAQGLSDDLDIDEWMRRRNEQIHNRR